MSSEKKQISVCSYTVINKSISKIRSGKDKNGTKLV